MQSIRELYKIGNGPSSSHTMGPKKACLYFLNKYPNMDSYEVVLYGSLALTGKGHLTDKIIIEAFSDKKIKVIFNYENLDLFHPNTMDIIGYKADEEIKIRVYSVGGGTILIDGCCLEANADVYSLNTFNDIKHYCQENKIDLAQYVYQNEDDGFKDYLNEIYDAMNKSIDLGLNTDGLLPGKLKVKRKAKSLLELSNKENELRVSAYAYAVAEVNGAGGEIVTAPTCGASGIVPACLRYLMDLGYGKAKLIDGLAVAGLIGNLIKKNASISGAECGCQAEVGSATSMAAALISFVKGYSINQIEHSAEIAMEHQLGLTCDPINGYVQIPCIERNAVASMRAIHAASLAYALGETQKISFDLVVETMMETGKDLNKGYRETSEAGLAKKYRY